MRLKDNLIFKYSNIETHLFSTPFVADERNYILPMKYLYVTGYLLIAMASVDT